MSPLLGRATSPSTAGTDLVLVPVGSVEQHGPHLPMDTDTVIAEAVTHRAAARLSGAMVAPALAYGSSGEHQSFPGTTSIGAEALHTVVVELSRSIRTWANRIVFVNGHGGNARPLRVAVDQLAQEGHDVRWVACAAPQGADAHAGHTETSLMLYLRPDAVRLDLAAPGNVEPITSLMPKLVAEGVRAVSANGVLGAPAGATAEQGRHLLDGMVRHVLERLGHVEA